MKKADIPKKVKKARVIPGYRCTLGIVVTMLSLIVLIPLASVLVHSLQISPREFFAAALKPNCAECLSYQQSAVRSWRRYLMRCLD